MQDFGKVYVLVTNAGITGGSPTEDYPFEDWGKMLEVNINGTILFAREAGKYMIEQGTKGAIIMVSSMSGRIVNRPQKQSAYSTLGLLHLVLSNGKNIDGAINNEDTMASDGRK